MKKLVFALALILIWLPSSSEAATVSRSYNWAGYAQKAGSYTSVSAGWTVVPGTDTVHTFSANAAWIGIGGLDGSKNLIQAGTRTMKWNGKITYRAWYELIPAPPVNLSLVVSPGDEVNSSITEIVPGMWKISFDNLTTGESTSVSVPYASNKASAEWIVERPSTGTGLVALTPFSQFTFSSLAAAQNGKAVTPVTAAAKKLLLIEKNGTPLLTPSVVGLNGTSFTVTARSSGIAGILGTQVRAL